MIVDFHLHSNCSDGLLSPEELVKESLKNNCSIIALTDHDIVNDYSYMEENYNLPIISGIEFNTSINKLHLLGYGIKKIDELNKKLYDLRKYNENVCIEVILKLQAAGYDISVEKVIDFLKNSNLEYKILDKRKLVKYLIYKGYVNNTHAAYQNLIGQQQRFYVPNKKMSPEEAINCIIECGGVAVLAHPNTINLDAADLEKEIKLLKDNGLTGVEVFNGKAKLNYGLILDLANKYDLIQTFGSDFHNPGIDKIGIFIENDEQVEKFCQKIKKKIK